MRLDAFRARVQGHLRALGRTQKELASNVGMHPNRLSHKLGGTAGAILTYTEVRRIVAALAAWGAITTQTEAIELLELGGHRRASLTPEDWSAVPFDRLKATPAPSVLPPAPDLAVRSPALPVPMTSFLGREGDVTAIRELLGETKLLTLTGVGGAGKTRLALQVAEQLRDSFADGAVFVSLAGVEDAGLVPAVVARTLGLRHETGDVRALVGCLQDKQMLLMIDNFKHVLAATSAVERLLAACPDLTILITSRVPLRLYGEHEYRVPPLPVTSGMGGEPGPAVQLFVQRARAVRPDSALTRETAAAVTEICAALDGLPLAIELAAARSKLFTPEAMLPRLRHRLGLLTGGARNLPQRQQTLRGTLDWSYTLLSEEERTLFRRLAVFSGFDPESVGEVCDTGADTLDRLVELADQSLLEYVPDEEGVCFRMLQTVREYAEARLAESGEAATIRGRHAAHLLQLAEVTEPHLIGPDQGAQMRRLDRELENLRAALGYLLNTRPAEALRLAAFLERYWGRRDHLAEGRWWLDAALERTADGGVESLRARALVADGAITASLGDFDRANTLLAEAMAIYESVGDREGVAATLAALGEPAFIQGDHERSRVYREQALAMHRQAGNRWGMADALSSLGAIAVMQHDIERASALVEESATLFEEIGDHWALASLVTWRGIAAWFRSERGAAVRLLRDAVRTSDGIGDQMGVAKNLMALTVLASFEEDRARTSRVYGATEAAFRRAGLGPAGTMLTWEVCGRPREVVEDPACTADIEDGRTLSVDEAVALVPSEYDT